MSALYTILEREAGKALSQSEGARKGYRRFAASNGVNHVDESYDLVDGSHLEFVCRSPQTLCVYEWRLYSPVQILVEEHAPTPIGYHTGRYSELMLETLRRYESLCSISGDAANLFVEVYCQGVAPSMEAVEAQRERGRRPIGGSGW